MQPTGEPVRRPPPLRPRQHAATAVAAAGWAVCLPAAGAVPAVDPAPAGLVLAALALALVLVLLLAAALGVCVGLLRARTRLAADLHDARSERASLHELLDAGFWKTDAAHRLVELRPPAGADEALPPVVGASLVDCFRPAHEAAFRAALEHAAPFDDIDGERVPSPSPGPGSSRLRGRPRTDALGAFCGYVGTWREGGAASGDRVPAAAAAASTSAGAVASASVSDAAGGSAADHESFGYTVSHDLRAPIRVVEGFTKIVKEDYGRLLDRVGNDHLDRVLGAAARMNSMIDALLALSKLSSQPLVRQPVNLSQLASYVADDLRRQWPERQVAVEIEPGLQVLGDPTLLRVVLENLLGNAWKYTAKRPQALIGFGRHGGEPHVFAVSDNGAGFDMRYADRLFGVFQRLHSANDFAGTGVGLASVRRIVQRHGGTIWAEAAVDTGAQFNFSLPGEAGRR